MTAQIYPLVKFKMIFREVDFEKVNTELPCPSFIEVSQNDADVFIDQYVQLVCNLVVEA